MFFYNQLTELTHRQFFVLSLVEIIVFIFIMYFFKRKMNLRMLFYIVAVAFILSLLSSIFGRGSFGGMAYHERFGWPFQYYTVSRSFGVDPNAPVPGQFIFDFIKFFANSFYWGFFPIMILLLLSKKGQNNRIKIFITGSAFLLIIITLAFSYINHKTERNSLILEEDINIRETNIIEDRNLEKLKGEY